MKEAKFTWTCPDCGMTIDAITPHTLEILVNSHKERCRAPAKEEVRQELSLFEEREEKGIEKVEAGEEEERPPLTKRDIEKMAKEIDKAYEELKLKAKYLRMFIREVERKDEKGEPVKASDEDLIRALIFAKRTGADPLMGDIVLFMGEPHLTKRYWERALRRRFPDCNVYFRPFTKEEREEWKLSETTLGVWCIIESSPGKQIAKAPGFASLDEQHPRQRGSAVERSHPPELACKRAFEDAAAIALGYESVKAEFATREEEEGEIPRGFAR